MLNIFVVNIKAKETNVLVSITLIHLNRLYTENKFERACYFVILVLSIA